MAEWMTIRVVLTGRPQAPLAQPPGRVLLAHGDHTFAGLAEGVDLSFGRWDLTPDHEFRVGGLVVCSDPRPGGLTVAASEDTTLEGAGLGCGSRFTYAFDLRRRWLHECVVETDDADPGELLGDEPPAPVAVDGWGIIPDQHGRLSEDEEVAGTAAPGVPGGKLAEQAAGSEPAAGGERAAEDFETRLEAVEEQEAAALEVVEQALRGLRPERDDAAMADVAAALRAEDPGAPGALLWAAADLEKEPEDDANLWLELAAAVVAPRGSLAAYVGAELPLDADASAAWAALEPADWAGAVIELVRAGVGQPGHAATLLRLVLSCPEVETGDLSEQDLAVLLEGWEVVAQLWRALGILDAELRLTRLGRWGLPEALRVAWGS